MHIRGTNRTDVRQDGRIHGRVHGGHEGTGDQKTQTSNIAALISLQDTVTPNHSRLSDGESQGVHLSQTLGVSSLYGSTLGACC
jgi:hypothetical protein